MLLDIILLVVGFVLLIKGADVFVEGASKVAAKFYIPEIVIGLTIVAFGTSAPEAAVSIASAYKGTAGIAVGNIIGSNICNVLITCKPEIFLLTTSLAAIYFSHFFNFFDNIISNLTRLKNSTFIPKREHSLNC